VNRNLTRAQLIQVAKQEIEAWKLPPGLVLAILFAFVHRATTGETVEETFFGPPTEADYEI